MPRAHAHALTAAIQRHGLNGTKAQVLLSEWRDKASGVRLADISRCGFDEQNIQNSWLLWHTETFGDSISLNPEVRYWLCFAGVGGSESWERH